MTKREAAVMRGRYMRRLEAPWWEIIEEWRRELGLTQEDVARLIDKPEKTYRNWIKQRNEAPNSQVDRLFEALASYEINSPKGALLSGADQALYLRPRLSLISLQPPVLDSRLAPVGACAA